MKRGAVIGLFGSVAVAWPVAAQMQSTQPTQSTTSSLPKIEVVRVKPVDPAGPKLRFQISDGSVDLMKVFSLGGSEGIGATWKMPPPTTRAMGDGDTTPRLVGILRVA